MIIKTRSLSDVRSSEITPEHVYRSRREFLQLAGVGAAGVVAGSFASGCVASPEAAQAALQFKRSEAFALSDPPNTFEQITQYNNFYEFGTNKNDPARYAHRLVVKPWTVK